MCFNVITEKRLQYVADLRRKAKAAARLERLNHKEEYYLVVGTAAPVKQPSLTVALTRAKNQKGRIVIWSDGKAIPYTGRKA